MIYFDHNATTPLEPQVLEGMIPWLQDYYGNPSALCRLGRLARSALDRARDQVARLVAVSPEQVVFTSGATEASNLALEAAAARYPSAELWIGGTEHPSVEAPLSRLSVEKGWPLWRLPTTPAGEHRLASWPKTRGPVIAALMRANNETGVIEDPKALALEVRRRGGFLHVDAVQAAGKIPLVFDATGAHTLALSAHKIGGPKGVGALIVESGLDLRPQSIGGGQERGLRPGTEPVAQIVGFGLAAELALQQQAARADRTSALRQRLEAGLEGISGVVIYAKTAPRLPNTTLFSVPGWEGETAVMALDRAGFCVSSGSACASGGQAPSPVLLAMGIPPEEARRAIRVSVGWANAEAEVDALLKALTTMSMTGPSGAGSMSDEYFSDGSRGHSGSAAD